MHLRSKLVDLLGFTLLTFSSIFILIDPITVTLFFVSLMKGVDRADQKMIARDASLYALAILLVFAVGGYGLLQLFGITLAALRIGGGVLLFLIGIEMVYARVSFTKQPGPQTSGEYKEEVAVTPLAIPIIAGPGAITTVIVLTGDAAGQGWPAIAVVFAAIFIVIVVVYYTMVHSYIIAGGIREKQLKVVNRVLGLLLLAIGVQFIITGIKAAFV
ncbi:MAG TPA: MarC family protein [Candidatus Acidoferrales bacterium]|nr:MarC family protein [Candidatus Acidoferrales bacterium]